MLSRKGKTVKEMTHFLPPNNNSTISLDDSSNSGTSEFPTI